MTMNIKQLEECLTNRNWKNLGAMAISYIYADGQTSRRPNNRRLLDINGPWGHQSWQHHCVFVKDQLGQPTHYKSIGTV